MIKKGKYTKDEELFLINNYNKMTYGEIANTLNRSENSIKAKAERTNLSKRKKINKRYFKEIDTPSKAYWLGFIFADGSICKNEFTVELKYDDKYILEILKKDLDYDDGIIKERHRNINFNGYKYTSHTARIRIYSMQVCEDLINNNIAYRKTYKNLYPKCDNYFWHFFRGFFDGDGCVYSQRNSLNVISLTNSNIEFLQYLNNKIEDLLSIKGHIYKEKEYKYRLVYCKKSDVNLIKNNMYKNKGEHYLLRKYVKFN